MKTMKIIKLIIIPALILLVGVIHFSCDLMSSPISGGSNTGTLVVKIPGAAKGNSSALKAPIQDQGGFLGRLVYRIECSGPGKVTKDFSAGDDARLTLATGNWNIKVIVLNNADLDKPLGSKTEQIAIEAGKTSSMDVDVVIDTDRCEIKSFVLTFGSAKSARYEIDQDNAVITAYFPFGTILPDPNTTDAVSYTLTHTGATVTPAPGTLVNFDAINTSTGHGVSGITVHALNGTDTKTYTVEVDNLPEPYVGDSVFTFYSSWNSLPWASYGFGGTPTLPSGSTVITDSNLANNFSRPYSWPDFEPGFEGVMIMLEGSNVSAIAGIFGNDLVSNYNFIDYTGLTNHHIYVKIAGINYYQVSMFEFDKYLLIMVFKFYEYDGGGGGETTFYVSNATEWQNAIDAIKNDADNYVFTINITANITGAAGYNVSTATFGSRYGIQVEIDGGGYSISLAPDQTGSLLHIGYGQAVSFEDVKLIGNSTNNSPLVMLSGGDMVMEGSSAISNNTNINPSGYGGGVFVGVYGNLFLMDGTSISNNKANQGGGVFVDTGNLKMYSDSIINNNVSNQGGGVYVNSGSLVMYSGSKIDYNDADLQGGGVYIVAQNNGDFYKHIGATLTGNTGNNTNILEEKLPATKEGHQAFVLVSSNPSDPLQARVYNSNIPPQFVLDSESDGWESWY